MNPRRRQRRRCPPHPAGSDRGGDAAAGSRPTSRTARNSSRPGDAAAMLPAAVLENQAPRNATSRNGHHPPPNIPRPGRIRHRDEPEPTRLRSPSDQRPAPTPGTAHPIQAGTAHPIQYRLRWKGWRPLSHPAGGGGATTRRSTLPLPDRTGPPACPQAGGRAGGALSSAQHTPPDRAGHTRPPPARLRAGGALSPRRNTPPCAQGVFVPSVSWPRAFPGLERLLASRPFLAAARPGIRMCCRGVARASGRPTRPLHRPASDGNRGGDIVQPGLRHVLVQHPQQPAVGVSPVGEGPSGVRAGDPPPIPAVGRAEVEHVPHHGRCAVAVGGGQGTLPEEASEGGGAADGGSRRYGSRRYGRRPHLGAGSPPVARLRTPAEALRCPTAAWSPWRRLRTPAEALGYRAARYSAADPACVRPRKPSMRSGVNSSGSWRLCAPFALPPQAWVWGCRAANRRTTTAPRLPPGWSQGWSLVG